jgi:peptidoglycan/xylan/chitin deacetylase (PgdA/CDA1 family)
MCKKIVLAATAVVSAAAVVSCWPQAVVRLLRRAFPNVIWEMRSPEWAIAITFDDGPDPVFTPKVLEILREHGIQATFFLVGERVRRFPELLQRIREEGHEVGNHSDSWQRSIQLSDDAFERDLLRAGQSLGLESMGLESMAQGSGPKLFRPAGGFIRGSQLRLLRKHRYCAVLGSAFAFDPYRPPRKYIEWAIGRGLKRGAIIVLHDSGGDRSKTVGALPAILHRAHAAGYRFVKLSDYV